MLYCMNPSFIIFSSSQYDLNTVERDAKHEVISGQVNTYCAKTMQVYFGEIKHVSLVTQL